MSNVFLQCLQLAHDYDKIDSQVQHVIICRFC